MNKCKTCGHDIHSHIYEEGACRPGFLCEASCKKFEPKFKKLSEIEALREENTILREINKQYENGSDIEALRKERDEYREALQKIAEIPRVQVLVAGAVNTAKEVLAKYPKENK